MAVGLSKELDKPPGWRFMGLLVSALFGLYLLSKCNVVKFFQGLDSNSVSYMCHHKSGQLSWQDLEALLSTKGKKRPISTSQVEPVVGRSRLPQRKKKVHVPEPQKPLVARKLLPGGSWQNLDCPCSFAAILWDVSFCVNSFPPWLRAA